MSKRLQILVKTVKNKLPDMGKLKWQCRRGVLELDMLLAPFLSEQYPHLPAAEKAVFVALLACTDEELLSWFFGDGVPESKELQQMVVKIRGA